MYDEQTKFNKSDAANCKGTHITNKTPVLPQVLTFKNTFAPVVKNKTLTLSQIITCLQFGSAKYEKLPKEAQDALSHIPDPLSLNVYCDHCQNTNRVVDPDEITHGVFILPAQGDPFKLYERCIKNTAHTRKIHPT